MDAAKAIAVVGLAIGLPGWSTELALDASVKIFIAALLTTGLQSAWRRIVAKEPGGVPIAVRLVPIR